MENLAQHLDFANHHANATPDDIKKLCADVVSHGFHAAFVNPIYVSLAKTTLKGAAPVGTVVSFPLGGDTLANKRAATNSAVSDGADELDVVPDIGAYFAGNKQAFTKELHDIVDSARMVNARVIVKFIVEPGFFDAYPDRKEKLEEVAQMIRAAGADYIKIGSGMGPRTPRIDDLTIIKGVVGDTIKIKVAGGIETREQAESFLAAGAYHLGTSHAISIVSGKARATAATHSSSE